MTYDIINLIIRIVILQFVGATSEVAFKRRDWSLVILSFGIWLTTFRLAIFRATSIYIGVFKYESVERVASIQTFITSGAVGNVTDLVLMVGVVLTYIELAKCLQSLKEDNNGRHSI